MWRKLLFVFAIGFVVPAFRPGDFPLPAQWAPGLPWPHKVAAAAKMSSVHVRTDKPSDAGGVSSVYRAGPNSRR